MEGRTDIIHYLCTSLCQFHPWHQILTILLFSGRRDAVVAATSGAPEAKKTDPYGDATAARSYYSRPDASSTWCTTTVTERHWVASPLAAIVPSGCQRGCRRQRPPRTGPYGYTNARRLPDRHKGSSASLCYQPRQTGRRSVRTPLQPKPSPAYAALCRLGLPLPGEDQRPGQV